MMMQVTNVGGKNSVLWVRDWEDGPRDTLFTNLTGTESSALNTGFAMLEPSQDATVTSPKAVGAP